MYRYGSRRRRKVSATVIGMIICAAVIVLILLLFFGVFQPKTAEEPEASALPVQTEQPEQSSLPAAASAPPKELSEMTAEEIWADDPREPKEVKGIFISDGTASRTDKMDDLIALCDRTELNAMVINVKNEDGVLTFDMESDTAREIGAVSPYIEDIDAFLQKLHDHDIYCIARIVAFQDPLLAESKPEYSLKNEDGTVFRDKNGVAWVNPYNRELWDYLVEIGKNAAAAGFDEVQYDYIRFSTDRGMDHVDFGPEAQTTTKQEIIAEFVEYMYRALAPTGVFVAADVYGVILCYASDGELIGQEYQQMAKYLDYICPMNYPSHYDEGAYGLSNPDGAPYELVYALMEDSAKELEELAAAGEHTAKVRAWLQDFTATWLDGYTEYGVEEIRAQIDAVYDAGYSEWFMWNAASNYTKEAYLTEDVA